MFNTNNQRAAASSIFMGSIQGLANTGAVAATFFLAPLFYSWSDPWIREFTALHYGGEYADPMSYLWFAISACLVFFTARASLSTLLVMGGLAVATRFL